MQEINKNKPGLAKRLLLFLFLLIMARPLIAQNVPDTIKKENPKPPADDPSNFLTRVEMYNELQHYDNDVYFNQTVLRTIVQIGKKFTTRLDIPFVYNSFTSPAKPKQSGIGDISFRVLGFKLNENPKSAITASLEISLNTAQSPTLGTGKNMLIPVLSYSRSLIPRQKIALTIILQQTNSVSGDKNRSNVSFTKLQVGVIKTFSRKLWMVLVPEWYLDYVNGGLSMNFRSRLAYAPKPRVNIWITPSVGIFGDFVARYQWSGDLGYRYYLFRKNPKK